MFWAGHISQQAKCYLPILRFIELAKCQLSQKGLMKQWEQVCYCAEKNLIKYMWKKLHNNRMNLCQQAWYHYEKNNKVEVFLTL